MDVILLSYDFKEDLETALNNELKNLKDNIDNIIEIKFSTTGCRRSASGCKYSAMLVITK